MNLHLDREAFAELVTAAANELRIPPGIIEKDYYVTLALHELTLAVICCTRLYLLKLGKNLLQLLHQYPL